MKKSLLTILLFVMIIFAMIGCSVKVTPNTNTQNISGDGNLIINSNLMNSLNRLGASYEFVPLGYKGGVARGIISPIKIDKYMLDSWRTDGELNPLRYTEYTINAFDISGFLKDTGEVLALNELSPYRFNVENPKNILLKDNKRKTEKIYTSRTAEDFVVEESDAYNSIDGYYKINNIYNKDGKQINLFYISEKTMGKDSRYVYSSYTYEDSNDNDIITKEYNNVMVIYDSKTASFYESNIIETKGCYYSGQEIFEVNNELYNLNIDGKIKKVILRDGKILFEEYYDLELAENQILIVGNAYDNNSTVVGDNVFVRIVTSSDEGVSSSNDSVLNMKDKTRVDLPGIIESQTSIEKIFSNSDNLVMISINNYGTSNIWIAKYEGGNFKNLVQIDKYSDNGAPILAKNIEDILYDNETNSFFIKRKITIDKKQSYQYEVLKLE